MTPHHANISVFVPHIGCPNRCSFCDQRSITGSHRAPSSEDVVLAVRRAVTSRNYDPANTEIAFFGGSFTAINRSYMLCLLKTAASFVELGLVRGIRISTRPDAIDPEILEILRAHHVTSIELGAQSMDDNVLKMNNRGHTAGDVRRASGLIRAGGFSLGLQMMTGLYGDSDEITLRTAREIIALRPDTVRIYPTVVLKNTDLAALYADRIYRPQELEEAVGLCAQLLTMFREASIRVIRLGLHAVERDSFVAGPWHPAFSELCHARLSLEQARSLLKEPGCYDLYVAPSAVSKMTGQKKENLARLAAQGYTCRVKADGALKDDEIRAERRI